MHNNMERQTTNGIQVSVVPEYQAAYSRPAQQHYVFAYEVTIHNQSSAKVQLLRRHWFIWDADGSMREVEGPGVIGKQPVLEPGSSHRYSSWSDISTGIGKMKGAFLMVNLHTQEEFQAFIPEFKLIAPVRLS